MAEAPHIEDQVRALTKLDLEGLRAVWSEQIGSVPKLRSPDLLRLMLAYRLQSKALGGLKRTTKTMLARKASARSDRQKLGLGAILRRGWQGQIVEVHVEDQGFRFDGRLYPSLSAIAFEVTRTRWNGPRFFGLRKDLGL